jgi:ATP-dependent RNA helicase HelY
VSAGADQQLTLDRFQLEAIEHLDAGRSVLVAAPTGAGKTLIAEHAVDKALGGRRRAFYTTPIKALSNQKYADFSDRYGSGRVGLLTGDNVVNPAADLVVMTTEVLRNMLYAGRTDERLDVVVLDEVHYLEDVFRGPVWEEVILNLPASVTLVCLSATVSNTDELGGWLESVRGATGIVVETERPVELVNLYAVGDRRGDRLHIMPTLVDGRPNPDGYRFDPERGPGRHRRHRPRRPWRTPNRQELLTALVERDLLPVIWFVFSRNGCDEAATALTRAGAGLTTPDEARRIRDIAGDRLTGLAPADQTVLDAAGWLRRLERGIAAHHAGLVPAFKETVEQCFAEGLIKVVFATETLALGVNLPARSVVIDRLTKFTGEHHEPLTPGQFTQLTGRAGRRGLDDRGHAIVPWSPFTTFDRVASLAASRSFRLRSAFRPTYNMVANLLERLDPESARALLARSFAQYQADSEIVQLEENLVRERRRREQLVEAAGTRRHADVRPHDGKDLDTISDAVSRLRPGDVVADARGDRFVVLGVSWRRGGRARIRLVDPGGHDVRWELAELDHAPDTIGRIELPFPMSPDRPAFRGEVAHALRQARLPAARRRRSRPGRDVDPVDQLRRTEATILSLERQTRSRESSIARRFDAVAEVLRQRGHLDGWRVTDSGRVVAQLYHECDLLVAEALTRGMLDDLEPATLAAVLSVFTHEHRAVAPPSAPSFPTRRARHRFEAVEGLAEGLRRMERDHGVPLTRAPEPGFASKAHRWAEGRELASLIDDELSAGDFVRNVKQLIDLMRQIATAAPRVETRSSARRAAEHLHRGVVAISGAVGE